MPTRRLAAIMFTDIEGYTQMMSEDEAKANVIRKRHREVFEELHDNHKGKIVQYFGDGTLSTFDSCVEAVRCAIAMQQAFREVPIVPLRIGIHLGDIEYSKTEVAGNGVNIASRIESLGVSGVILVSDEVRKQVENHHISMVSMGHFKMKNVKEPIEVYSVNAEGLIVPNPKSLQGKAKRVNPVTQAQKIIRFASIGFMAMALGAVLFWALGADSANGQLSKKIKEERVAAIPFTNNTGDAHLDALGSLCSNLITNGLTEAGIKTCSPQTVQQYSHLIGVLPNNPEGTSTFEEVVGARYRIEGYFWQEGDSLTVKSNLTDGLNEVVVRNFPDIKGHVNEKEKLADQLTRRVMGYWVAKDVIDQGKFKPPLYEAFLEYQKAFETVSTIWGFGGMKHGKRAFELDSTFYTAGLYEMLWLADGRNPRTDTLIQRLLPHYDEMTEFERLSFDANIALYESRTLRKNRWKEYTQIREKQYQMFPTDYVITSFYSFHLGTRENRPSKAWEVNSQVDLESFPEELHSARINRAIYRSISGLNAGKYDEVLKLLNTYLKPEKRGDYQGIYYTMKSQALSRNNRIDSLYQMMEEVKQITEASSWFKPQYDMVAFCNEVANELLLKNEQEEASKFLNLALEWAFESPQRMSSLYDSLDIAETYRLLGQYQTALDYTLSNIEDYTERIHNIFARNRYLAGLAVDYTLLGEIEKAESVLEKVWGPAQTPIYAALGRKEEAVQNLKTQIERGVQIYSTSPQYNYLNKPLFDYPPFQEFVRVKD